MNDTPPVAPQRKSHIITILTIAFILSIIGIIFNFIFTVKNLQLENQNRIGDGFNVESYGFDLSNCSVDKNFIAVSGLAKDGLEIIDFPEFITANDVDALKEEIRGKYQVSGDKVVGVNINGDIRAYPIRILQWHEVINDVVGEIPIAVTYSPFSDSVVVFDRRVSGETLEFGVSGLLYNSTLLMYDRRDDSSKESLWSQLQFRAVSGQAADENQTLTVLPCVQTRWDEWKKTFPNTKIVKPNVKKIRQYQGDPYGPYHSMDNINFDVSPTSPSDEYNNKTKMLVLSIKNQFYPIPYSVIQNKKNETGKWEMNINGNHIPIHYKAVPELCWVGFEPLFDSTEVGVIYAYHFAWYSHHPNTEYILN